VIVASIPSPTTAVWHLGPFPLRAYALCIILGVVAAVMISDRRMQARGGPKGAIMDVAVFAVPFGIIGARIYHIITSPQGYFGENGHPLAALKIWEGGLGIWGAIAGGALGAWIACRRLQLPLRVVADVVAPGIAVAQAIGRFGNWFNQELFGRPTSLPWGLEIEPGRPGTVPGELTYHPTFLYESLWCLGVAALVIWADKRFRLGQGRVFALYAMAYVVGRVWIEALRIDEANHILGLRLNIWTCLIVFAGALAYFLTHRGPREQLVIGEDGRFKVVTAGDTGPGSADVEADTADAAGTEASAGADAGTEASAGADAPAGTDAERTDPAEADRPAEADAADATSTKPTASNKQTS
jgi:prolipoprotein diacylglyceryl transferase